VDKLSDFQTVTINVKNRMKSLGDFLLHWGEHTIQPCENKWNFVFEVEEIQGTGGISSA